MTIVVPWVVIGNTVDVVPVTVPAQLSVVVCAVNDETEHSAVTSASVGLTGGVTSGVTFKVNPTVPIQPLLAV